jgi:hypothetical protein
MVRRRRDRGVGLAVQPDAPALAVPAHERRPRAARQQLDEALGPEVLVDVDPGHADDI